MKVTTAKHGLRSIVTAFFLFGAMLFCASSVNAQAVDQDLSLNWVNESEALTALDNSINLLVADQANYAPGSPQWVSDANHIGFYKWTMQHIQNGLTVPNAVALSALTINDDKDAAQDMLPPAVVAQLKNDATSLLTQ